MSASKKKKLRHEQKAAAMTEKQKQEQKEAKKLKAYTLTFAIVMVLVVAIVVGVIVTPMIEGAIRRGSHAVTIGEHQLSAGDLTYFYVDAISEHQNEVYNQYYSTFGNYWSMMLGFDASMPLNKQIYDKETGKNWAEHFIDEALENAKEAYALYDSAVAAGHKLTAEEQASVDSYLSSLELYATYNDFSSVKAYLRNSYGVSATEDSYKAYYNMNALGSSYYNAHSDSLKYEVDDYRAWEKGGEDGSRFDDYSSFSYVYYTINYTSYLGEGKKNESGTTTWTDAEKDAARAAAKADMEKLLASGITDKETFDKAVQALDINKLDKNGKPYDPGKAPTATEAKDIFYTNMVFRQDAIDWMVEKDRKPGDIKAFDTITYANHEDEEHEHSETCGCASTVDGYSVVLFTERDDNIVNMVNVRHILVKFTGGTKDKDGNTVYSEAEKAKAKEEAEKLLKQWQDSVANETDSKKKEDKFGELANKESDDQNGKVTNGGLYEDVYPGQMVKAFEDWCFAEDRKAGDTGIVETEYGYHVMFYSSTDEMTYRDSLIEKDLRADDMEKWHADLVAKLNFNIVNLKHMEYDLVVA